MGFCGKKALFSGIFIAQFILFASASSAQSFNYIDEAGNVNFAESLSEVPPRYRDQIVPPTPIKMTQKEYKKYLASLEKKKKAEAKLKEKEEMMKAKEKERKLRAQQKEINRQKRTQEKMAKDAEKRLGGSSSAKKD